MAKDYTALAEQIVRHVGGKENISDLTHCMTRLRFSLKDEGLVDKLALEQTEGVIKVMLMSGQYQIVIGNHVEEVHKAIERVTGVKYGGRDDSYGAVEAASKNQRSKNIVEKYIDMVSGIFMPILYAMMGAAMVKTIAIVLSSFGVLSDTSTTYTILYAMGDAFFYFLPIFLAFTTAEKFNANKFVAVCIAATLVYPNITALQGSGEAVTFLGIPVIMVSYPSSVLPILIAVYVQSKVEHLLKKVIPQVIRGVFVPIFTLLIVIPVTLIVVGPITSYLGQGIGNGIEALFRLSPVLTALVFGTVWQILILFGLHHGVIPIVINNISTLGGDFLLPLGNGATFAVCGSVLAVMLKTKKKKLREIATPALLGALIGGITEPAIYSICLKYKKPFFITCICAGLSAIPMALANVMWPGIMSVNLLTIPAQVGIGGMAVVWNMLIAFAGSFVLTWMFGFNDSMVIEE